MITLPIKTLKTTLDKVFSSTGYSFKDFAIKLPQPLNMIFGIVNENKISLKFVDKLPKISWKKFITISALIQEIILDNDGGIIRIKYFPDLKFQYSKSETINFYSSPIVLEELCNEINAKYPDEERRKIASLCLHYANEWVTMCCSSGVSVDELVSNKDSKKNCYRFVKESIIKNENKYGSIVISFILIYVILPIILKWVIELIFKKLSN
jgi:hypothetical protein